MLPFRRTRACVGKRHVAADKMTWAPVLSTYRPPILSTYLSIRAQHFLRSCTHTQTTSIHNDLCPPMPTHAIQITPMYSKIITLPIISHMCPPKTRGHGWAWVWAPNVGLCDILLLPPSPQIPCDSSKGPIFVIDNH